MLIERVCSKIVLPKALEKQVIHLFRKRGYRFPAQQVGLLQELAEHPKEKLLRTKASAIKRLTQEEAKLLKGRGHRDIQDDRELIEAARAVGANIITQNPWILKTRPELKKELNVGVYWPDQVHG